MSSEPTTADPVLDDERGPDWRASWITSGEDGPAAPLLRTTFEVPAGVVAGRLHVAGLGLHRTTLNGEPVTDARLESGFTAYDKTVIFSSYDVALSPGRAALGVELGRGFYALTTPNVWRWEQPPWRSVRKALVQLELLDADGRGVGLVVSDESWRWSAGPTRFDSYYEGESYDARCEQPGWDTAAFDDRAWAPVVGCEAPAGRLVPRRHEPVRVVETWEVSWSGGGDRPLVADVGRTIAGWVEVELEGLAAGTTVDLVFGEELRADGSVRAENPLVHADRHDTDQVVVGHGPLRWEPRFTYQGFRYVQVIGVDDPAAVRLRARHAHNDVAPVSTFSCSDPVLSWIDRAMRLTVRNNLHHIPTDTPVYEKNGWTGDAQVAAEAMMAQFDLERLFEKWLDDMADSQLESGLIPVIIPSGGWGYDELAPAPEWTTLYPFLLERVISWYDRPALVERHLGPVLRYLDYELTRIDADGLTSGVLGDYLTPGSQGTPPHDDLRIAASCYLHRALRLTAGLVEDSGWTAADGSDPSGRLRAAADALAAAINTTFLDPVQGCYRSEREPAYRQTSNVLPLAMGITPADQVDAVVGRLVQDLHDHDDHHDAGCLGLSQLFGVLTAYGHGELAVRVATQTTPPSWGAWMAAGETTLREMWGAESRSHNHYFMGAMASWLYADVAGVRLLAPGWREFEVRPLLAASLEHAAYCYSGPLGPLGASWRRVDGRVELTVTVPTDTRALVHLPDREPFWVSEGERTFCYDDRDAR